MHMCIWIGCGPVKPPWVTFTFTDSGQYGTITRASGVHD
jgi:hypothetical protein